MEYRHAPEQARVFAMVEEELALDLLPSLARAPEREARRRQHRRLPVK